MKLFNELFLTAIYTVFVQNLILSTGLGLSEAIRVSTKPGMFGKFAAMVSGFSVATSALCALLNTVPEIADAGFYARAAVYGCVLVSVYLLTAVVMRFVFRASHKSMSVLGIAALNTLVFAVPFINNSAAYTFASSIGSGIGAGIAFMLAAALISKGSQTLAENKNIPEIFKGTPALFFYVGLLSLAFAGFSDSTLFA